MIKLKMHFMEYCANDGVEERVEQRVDGMCYTRNIGGTGK